MFKKYNYNLTNHNTNLIIIPNYQITKTLNNNLLISKTNNHQLLLIPNPIPFNKKLPIILHHNPSIDKLYKLQHQHQKQHYKTLVHIAQHHVLQALI
ncbi:CAT RNA binding domain-containing protein, partial [Staphylococcus capitis]|uniref:CAT RNA binding domain-containing protein n=1 Tax=Staphylococcus capitis TaxID=29388 RepID=UPI00370942B6